MNPHRIAWVARQNVSEGKSGLFFRRDINLSNVNLHMMLQMRTRNLF